MSRIIDRQRFKRIYPFYKPRPQDGTLDSDGSQTSPNATYVVINSDPELPNERVITPGSGMSGSDGGAGSSYTLSVDPNQVAFLSGCQFTGPVNFLQGLSGSLQTLTSGISYLVGAGTVLVTTGSNGQIFISGSGGSSDLTGYAQLAGATFTGYVTASLGLSASFITTNNKVCYPEQFGARGDNSTDDSIAIQAAFDAIKSGSFNSIEFGARTYKIASTITWNATGSISLRGQGIASAIHATDAVTGSLFLFRNADDIHVGDMRFYGDAAYNSAGVQTAAGGGSNQNAIEVGYLGSDGTSRLRVSNVTSHNLGGRGLSFAFGDDVRGVQIDNYSAYQCLYGCYASDAAVLTNFQAERCSTGIMVGTGNVFVDGGDVVNCAVGADFVSSGNAAHGIFAGMSFRHNTRNVRVRDIPNGHLFNGCTFYEGDILFDGGNETVFFNGGLMDMSTYYLDGKAIFNGVGFDTAYYLSSSVSANTRFVECRHISGSSVNLTPSWFDNSLSAKSISGSLTRTIDGLSYLVSTSPSSLSITSQSNGQIFLSASVGGGSVDDVQSGGNYGNYRDVIAYSARPSTSSTSFVRAAMFEFDPSIATNAGSGTRTIKLRAIAETTGPQITIQLYNVSTSAVIAGSSLTSTSLTPELLSSGDLTSVLSVGSALYEVQMKMASGLPADVVDLGFAGLRLEWA